MLNYKTVLQNKLWHYILVKLSESAWLWQQKCNHSQLTICWSQKFSYTLNRILSAHKMQTVSKCCVLCREWCKSKYPSRQKLHCRWKDSTFVHCEQALEDSNPSEEVWEGHKSLHYEALRHSPRLDIHVPKAFLLHDWFHPLNADPNQDYTILSTGKSTAPILGEILRHYTQTLSIPITLVS